MKIDKKYYPMIAVAGGIVLIIIIAIIFLSISKGGNKSFAVMEKEMLKAAQSYFKENASLLPKKSGEVVDVDATSLVASGKMKDFNEYNSEVVCNGKVSVLKTQSGSNYVAILDCGEAYKTKLLIEEILPKVVTEEEGLYSLEESVTPSSKNLGLDEDGYNLGENPLLGGYVYRGNNVDNYILIEKDLYRIVKIDNTNDLQIFPVGSYYDSRSFDNSYNSEKEGRYGYNDYKKSMLRSNLDKNVKEVSDKSLLLAGLMVPKNICIGGRTTDDKGTDGFYECSRVFADQYVSLLTTFDIMVASLDQKCNMVSSKECSNYNYLFKDNYKTITITPNLADSSEIYRLDREIRVTSASNNSSIIPNYFISKLTVFESGTGSKADPYIIK